MGKKVQSTQIYGQNVVCGLVVHAKKVNYWPEKEKLYVYSGENWQTLY